MATLWFLYVVAYSYAGDSFYGYGSQNLALKGMETRFVETSGPEGMTLEGCQKYADNRRKAIAAEKKLNTYTRLKFECIQLP